MEPTQRPTPPSKEEVERLNEAITITKRNRTKWASVVTFIMVLLVSINTISFACSMYIVAKFNHTLPDFGSLIVAFICPTIITWQSMGIFNNDHKAVLNAVLGVLPQNNPVVEGLYRAMNKSK